MAIKGLIVFLMLFFINSSFAAEGIGTFSIVKGSVKISRNSQNITAKTGARAFEGDIVTTAKDARAKISMDDRNIISVSPDSTFTIVKYVSGAAKNVELNLKSGKIRSDVQNKYDGEKTKYLIKTPTAVAGVRGTDFITSFNATTKVTEVITFSGKVMLDSSTAGGSVAIPAGQTSSASEGTPPAPPKPATQEQMNEVKKEFEAPTDGANSQEPKTEPVADTKNESGKDQGKKPEDTAAKDTAGNKGKGNYIGDKTDQSSDTFTKGPGANTPPPKAPMMANPVNPVGPGFGSATPGSTSPVQGIIQNNPQNTKVIIKPTTPNSGSTTGR